MYVHTKYGVVMLRFLPDGYKKYLNYAVAHGGRTLDDYIKKHISAALLYDGEYGKFSKDNSWYLYVGKYDVADPPKPNAKKHKDTDTAKEDDPKQVDINNTPIKELSDEQINTLKAAAEQAIKDSSEKYKNVHSESSMHKDAEAGSVSKDQFYKAFGGANETPNSNGRTYNYDDHATLNGTQKILSVDKADTKDYSASTALTI
jgi:hypothetical protein